MYRVLVADDEPIERMIVGRTIKKYFSELSPSLLRPNSNSSMKSILSRFVKEFFLKSSTRNILSNS